MKEKNQFPQNFLLVICDVGGSLDDQASDGVQTIITD